MLTTIICKYIDSTILKITKWYIYLYHYINIRNCFIRKLFISKSVPTIKFHVKHLKSETCLRLQLAIFSYGMWHSTFFITTKEMDVPECIVKV